VFFLGEFPGDLEELLSVEIQLFNIQTNKNM